MAEHNNQLAEQSVIGALLHQPYKADDLECSPDDFFDAVNRTIYSAIVDMSEANKAIDLITLAEYLDQNGQLDYVGGLPYLSELMDNTPTTNNIQHYAKSVRNQALLRELKEIAFEIVTDASRGAGDADDLIATAEAKIYSIMDKRETSEPVEIKTAVEEALTHLGDVLDGVTYQSTGLTELDSLIGGLRGGATYVIAARSSMGKTALMCSIAHHVAQSKRCYIATLEMPRREIASRLMAIDANLNLGDVKNWTTEDYTKLSVAASRIQGMNIVIDHEEGLTLAKLRARTRRMKRRGGLGCIFVDYLQLMKSRADTREREVALISEGLKSLSKELDVPIVVLAQLNRDCDKRADKRPLMSDLRESGSIEQDADVIIMLYRDEVYDKDTMMKGMAELVVRKNRHGSIGEIFVEFNAETMRFKDKAHDWMLPINRGVDKPAKKGFYAD
jgi:replicative DNA helicase